MRATIVVEMDDVGQVAAEAWRGLPAGASGCGTAPENTGCGCCVDMWDVDAPDEAVAELPEALSAMSEWTHPRRPS